MKAISSIVANYEVVAFPILAVSDCLPQLLQFWARNQKICILKIMFYVFSDFHWRL
jgi:hypothetical protein